MEDCSSQYDDDDSDYYPSSQDSQASLLEMGLRRIESVYKVEERKKENIETSSGVINKQEPEVEERRKEKLETSSMMINKQKPEVEERRKANMETSSTMINKKTPIVVPELMEEVMKSDDNSGES